ncbi:MAG: TRAP transporter small permease [Ectothiorhodospiraceae bacterium]|nr:TRAP transporter small permease [Ectothiorhodospiraceae bacterium]
MRTLDHCLLMLVRYIAIIAGLFMMAMMLQVTLDVLLRWLFRLPIPGTLEFVANYYMVALIFLPLGLVTCTRDHIVVELFTRTLSPQPLAALTLFGNLLAFLYSLALMGLGALEAYDMTLAGETWSAGVGEIVIWPSRWLVPIGCSVMAAYFLLHSIDDLVCALTGRRPLDAEERANALYE